MSLPVDSIEDLGCQVGPQLGQDRQHIGSEPVIPRLKIDKRHR